MHIFTSYVCSDRLNWPQPAFRNDRLTLYEKLTDVLRALLNLRPTDPSPRWYQKHPCGGAEGGAGGSKRCIRFRQLTNTPAEFCVNDFHRPVYAVLCSLPLHHGLLSRQMQVPTYLHARCTLSLPHSGATQTQPYGPMQYCLGSTIPALSQHYPSTIPALS